MNFFDIGITPGWRDIVRRQKIDRLLMFLSRFDDNRRFTHIEAEVSDQGYVVAIKMKTASGDCYQRPMDYVMEQRLEVFEHITLYFYQPLFREEHPEGEDLIEKSLVLIETLFRVDTHFFDRGVNGIALQQARPLSNLSPVEAVNYVRSIYDYRLDQDFDEVYMFPKLAQPDPQSKDAGLEAFMDELNALLAEDDDLVLPPEDQLPKAMPTG